MGNLTDFPSDFLENAPFNGSFDGDSFDIALRQSTICYVEGHRAGP